jgi:hypothetical protein
VSVAKGSEEYPTSFVLIAIAWLLLLGLIVSHLRAKKAGKPEIPKLFE